MKRISLFLMILLPALLLAYSISVNVPLSVSDHDFGTAKFSSYGWGTVSSPGSFQLPVKTVNVLLPPGATVDTWQVNMDASRSVPGTAPQRNGVFSNGESLLGDDAERNITNRYQYLGMKKWGEMNYASFSIIPASWDGESWQLSSSCQIDISYSGDIKNTSMIPQSYSKNDYFVNQTDLNKWYSSPKNRNAVVLVISTQALYNAMAPWVAFRQSQGCEVSFIEVSSAINQGVGGNDAARLHSFLQNRYQYDPFEYLVLIGDHDTVPVAYLTPEPDGSEQVPSDFFYGDLSSNWDSDNDGRLGEYSSAYMDQDWEVDFTPEAYVGRISNNNASQVAAIANRIVAFEQNIGTWKNNNLLPAAFLNYLGEPEPNMPATDGALFMEYLRDTTLNAMPCTSLYEQEGVVPSYPGDIPLSSDNFRTQINTISWGLINWSAHGSSSSSSRKVWMQDYNQNNFPDADEMEWMGLVNRSSFDNLSNTDGTVIFAASCYNGMIDGNSASLAEYALQKKGVGVFGATRTGWYKVGWLNPGWGGLSSYNHHFLENYRQNGLSLGMSHAYANLLHCQYYLFGDPIDAGGIIWPELQNVYTYMLFGDPMVGYSPNQTLPQGEILVWEPLQQQGLPVVNALREATGMNVIYTDKLIVDYDYINNFEAVFCLFGFGDTSYILSSDSYEYSYLNSYLENGGKLYLEGDVFWDVYDPFWSKFNIHTPVNGLIQIQDVRHLVSGSVWEYAQPTRMSPVLVPFTDTANVVFTNQTMEPLGSGIGVWNSNGSYRTLGSTFRISDIVSGTNTLTGFISIICDTLEVLNNASVDNSDPGLIPVIQKLVSFPNPSNSITNLHLQLAKSAPVSLSVYNIKGQRVQSLYSKMFNPGEYWLSWDGKDESGMNCADGIYFFRLETDKEVLIRKHVLLRH